MTGGEYAGMQGPILRGVNSGLDYRLQNLRVARLPRIVQALREIIEVDAKVPEPLPTCLACWVHFQGRSGQRH
jgi:hypothetical protein